MDYADKVQVTRHDAWASFLESRRRTGGRLVLFTTASESLLTDVRFEPEDCLLFGRESAGVPAEVHNAADLRVRIPIVREARSLNVAMAAGIALWEALRQTGGLPRA